MTGRYLAFLPFMRRAGRIHRAACSFALLTLALMFAWFVHPNAVSMGLAKSIGQVLLFALTLVLVADWRAQAARLTDATAGPRGSRQT
jgi:hypothetical protein